MNESGHAVPFMRVRATLTVAAAYIYFLLFAEFAFLELVRQSPAALPHLREIMAALGLGGIAGSMAPNYILRLSRHPWALGFGFALCAVAAEVSLASNVAWIFLAAILTGLAAGWTTVVLATYLKRFSGDRALPFVCGVGAGIAYAVCNVPAIFRAPPQGQAAIAWVVALCGALLAPRLGGRTGETSSVGSQPLRRTAVIGFFALVWLDSAAFFIIQHSASLRSSTWWSGDFLLAAAAIHFAGALAAACLLYWKIIRPLLVLAAAALALGCFVLRTHGSAALTSLLYTSGVSLYSTALIWVPARIGEMRFTGILYSVAGWGSSALAIGMAQDLQGIPTAVIVAALAAVAVSVSLPAHR